MGGPLNHWHMFKGANPRRMARDDGPGLLRNRFPQSTMRRGAVENELLSMFSNKSRLSWVRAVGKGPNKEEGGRGGNGDRSQQKYKQVTDFFTHVKKISS